MIINVSGLHYKQHHQFKLQKNRTMPEETPKGGCLVGGSLLIIAKFRTVISGTEVDIGKKTTKKRQKTEHQKKTIIGLFGGFQCACKTVRDHVLPIVGKDTLQCITLPHDEDWKIFPPLCRQKRPNARRCTNFIVYFTASN